MPGPRCSVGKMLGELSDTDRAAVEDAINGSSVTAHDLSLVLRTYGHHVMPQTIRRHARDLCSCSREPDGVSAELSRAGSIDGALTLLTTKGGRA